MSVLLRVTFLLCSCYLVGCQASAKHASNTNPAPLHLKEAREIWDKSAPEAYEFHTQRKCFCALQYVQPMVIQVKGKQIIRAYYSADDSQVPEAVLAELDTIDSLFRKIQGSEEYARSEFSFNHKLGYPTDVFFDRYADTSDDELSIKINWLKPLEL